MAKMDQGILIIIDIGRNVSTPEGKNEKSFFSEARECAGKIIERKIMSQGKTLIGIMLLGSKNTKNDMAEQCPGAFRRIELLYGLKEPNWEMIRSLPENPSNSRGDWIEALVVAADHYKNGVSGVKMAHRKIVLMTNFLCATQLDSNDIDQVLNGLQADQLEVDIIGPDLFDENLVNRDIELARQFNKVTGGATEPFENTMSYLLFHKKKMTNPRPWNVDLSIGPNVKIPVSVYIRLRDEPVVKNWRKAVKDPVTFTASTTEGVMKGKVHVNVENQNIVDKDNLIKGYSYGRDFIPFGENDKTMLYESGEKCLSIYGFTDASNVNWNTLCGDGLQYIFGRKGNKKCEAAVRCLVECLHELKMVGLVRRVYNSGNAPKMFAVMPVIDSQNFICLSMAEVCFKDDIKNMSFPSTNLKKFACTDEQVNAFKDLINAMDLTKAYDETFDEAEAFPIAETVSPSAQYVLDCIAYRAMNPGKPLPEPREDIMMLFKQPPMIEKRSREPLEKLKKLFTLNEIEVKSKRKKDGQASDIITTTSNTDEEEKPIVEDNENETIADMKKIEIPKKTVDVVRVGTVRPIEDYKALVNKDKKLSDLAPQMIDAIESMIYYNIDGNYSKALDAMSFFREESVKADPSHYSKWIQKFKIALAQRNKQDVVDLIKEKKLGCILKAESSLSTYETEDNVEDSLAYDNDTIPNSTNLDQSTINDMFDEM